MSKPKYIPSSYLPDGHVFGGARRPSRTDLPRDAAERARVRASQLQERAAYLALRPVRNREVTRAQLQSRTGWSRERLSRILNGAVVATLEDLFLILDAAGIPFAELAWTGSQADFNERQRLTLLMDFLDQQQASMMAKIAHIEQERRATSAR